MSTQHADTTRAVTPPSDVDDDAPRLALREPVAALGMITTAALAQALGKRHARAARDWCQRHGIPYRRDGKFNWVRVADVQRVLEGLPVTRAAAAITRRDEAVFDGAAKLMRRK